jgi:cytochrome P450
MEMESEVRSGALTQNDPRYEEMFSVENETLHAGHVLIDDPYPAFAALRNQSPVYMGNMVEHAIARPDPQFASNLRPHYTTLSFEACSTALVDNETYSSVLYQEQGGVMENIGHTVLSMVGNEHARHRAAFQPMMTRQQAMGWWRETWIEPFVATLVDGVAQQEEGVDLALSLCARLPMHTVTAAYGLTSEEALAFRENLLVTMNPGGAAEQREAARATVRGVLLAAVGERRRERRDDLISRLIDTPFVDADGNPSALDDEAILNFSRLLLLAGGGTTYRQMGILIFALLSNRDQLEALRADRSLMQAAIEESVRWNCTDPIFYRLATRDSALCGVNIPQGAIVGVCLGAGNHDPKRWDQPDRYDLNRPERRHVGFAAGPHTCLGRFVASAEMTAAVNAVLDRFPKLRLDERGEPTKIIGGLQARGVNHLRVRFD